MCTQSYQLFITPLIVKQDNTQSNKCIPIKVLLMIRLSIVNETDQIIRADMRGILHLVIHLQCR